MKSVKAWAVLKNGEFCYVSMTKPYFTKTLKSNLPYTVERVEIRPSNSKGKK